MVLALVVVSFGGAEVSVGKFFEGLPKIGKFLSEAFPPSFERIDSILAATLETFQMALAGSILGVILSLPLAILSSTRQTPHFLAQWVARGFIALFRTVPDLVWAIIFVISVGLGPFAGMLAIMVDTMGFCGRFFSEAMDETDKRPQEALIAIGARKISTIVCAVLPAAMPSFVNTSLFALEKAVRSSVVLGLVGAGGIGLELKVSLSFFRYDTALTIILIMFVLVVGVERLSLFVRKRYL